MVAKLKGEQILGRSLGTERRSLSVLCRLHTVASLGRVFFVTVFHLLDSSVRFLLPVRVFKLKVVTVEITAASARTIPH